MNPERMKDSALKSLPSGLRMTIRPSMRQIALVAALLALSALRIGTAAAAPAVEFVEVAECSVPVGLGGSTLLAGRFVEGIGDSLAAYREDDQRIRFFRLAPDGCFAQSGEQELAWAPKFATTTRQEDGTETLYLARPESEMVVRVRRSGRPTAALEHLPLPGTPVRISAPPRVSPKVEMVVNLRDGRWVWSKPHSDGTRWSTLELASTEPIHSLTWDDSGSRLIFLGALGSFASAIYAVDFSGDTPRLSPLKQIALLPSSSFEIAGFRGHSAVLWAERDSSLWDDARDERGPFLRRIAQLPDISRWLSPLAGNFFGAGERAVVLMPEDSRELWIYSQRVELAKAAAIPRRGSPGIVGDFDNNGRAELVVVNPEGSAVRMEAVRRQTPAQPAEVIQRTACTGYSYLPGFNGRWAFECPRGYAVVAIDDSSTGTPSHFFTVDCCPLPREDVLQDDLPGSFSSCPDGSVATSGPLATDNNLLRCSKVNPRYLLGEPRPGVYWGDGFSIPRTKLGIERMGIPEALREGIGRESRTVWDVDGCIGSPPGSLLTTIGDGSCAETRFRPLLFSGAAGDPPRGTAVGLQATHASGSENPNSEPLPSSLSSSTSER